MTERIGAGQATRLFQDVAFILEQLANNRKYKTGASAPKSDGGGDGKWPGLSKTDKEVRTAPFWSRLKVSYVCYERVCWFPAVGLSSKSAATHLR
jgi:hypothetical protein